MIIQLNPAGYSKYIHLLAQSTSKIHSSSAWAEVLWSVGEHAEHLEGQDADILRISLQDFADQVISSPPASGNSLRCKDEEVKFQIITLAAKIHAKHFPTTVDTDSLDPRLQQIDLMYQYVMSLARYDVSYSLRDRARYLKNLQLNASAREWLFVPKPVPKMTGLGERGQEWVLGSVAQVVGWETTGEIPLPEWGSEIPEAGVRDISEPAREVLETITAPVMGPRVGQEVREKKKEKKIIRDLDKFYASESETEEEDEEDDEDEESEEEEAQHQRSESEKETDEESEEDNTERLPQNREWS